MIYCDICEPNLSVYNILPKCIQSMVVHKLSNYDLCLSGLAICHMWPKYNIVYTN